MKLLKKLPKISKKTVMIAAGLILLLGIPAGYYLLSNNSEDTRAWYNSSWLYRKAITVANPGDTLTNEEVLITIDTATLISASKLQNDCDDLRFLDSDDSTLLDYWIEGGCNTSATQVWVEIPSLPSGGKTVYVYYGNPSVENAEVTWTGKFVTLSKTSCPAGWSREDTYDNRLPYGSSSYGTTFNGQHNHSQVSCTSGYCSALHTVYFYDGSCTRRVTPKNHYHDNLKADINNAEVIPPYIGMVYCSNNDYTVFQDSVYLDDESTLPTNTTRFNTLDGKYPRGSSSYDSTGGGSDTHSHTTSGGYTTGSEIGNNQETCNQWGGYPAVDHTHTTADGTTLTGNNNLPYLDMVYVSADNANVTLDTPILMVDSLPPMGWERFTALDGKFPKGAATYGGSSSGSTHTHSVTIYTNPWSNTTTEVHPAGTAVIINTIDHYHTCTTTSSTATALPAYVESIFVERKASSTVNLSSTEESVPTTPTSLQTEGQTNPTDVTDLTPEFSAVFNDPDASDTGEHYQVQVSITTSFTETLFWDSSKTAISSVSNGTRSADISYAGTPLSLDGTTYYWRIKFWDSDGAESPWSSTANFTMDLSETWYASEWLYRQAIVVTNPGSLALNEDVLVVIDTSTLISAGKMQSNCNDIRFVNSDGTTLLDYWIEGLCNTTTTQIWVQIPTLPTGEKTIYMYYGNSTAVAGSLEWGGTVLLYADTTCPAGWTRASTLDNKFLYGSDTYGSTGGSDSHSHNDAVCSSSSISTTNVSGLSTGTSSGTTTTHSHDNLKAGIDSNSSVLPPYRNMILCYKADFNIAQGLISLFTATPSSGWTRASALDNYFPRTASTYGSTGGSTTHSHTTTGITTNTSIDSLELSAGFSATGGTVTTSGSYTIHTFTSSGTFTPSESGSVDVLVVAGGGGGGSAIASHGGAGGGGAGGHIYNSSYSVSAGGMSITVGSGGSGAAAGASNKGTSGSNSIFGTLTAIGGGGGGGGYLTGTIYQGLSGGSGGGAGWYNDFSYAAGAAGTSGQGNSGGGNGAPTGAGAGGGGGAGTAGSIPTNSPTHNGGNGGTGLANSITGTSSYYAGGGGGGGWSSGGTGGTGGGGNGGTSGVNGSNATANTGGGGGGGYNGGGGNGASGIVIVRYLTASSTGSIATSTHTHSSDNSTVSTASNVPPYMKVIFAKADSTTYVDASHIIMTSELQPLGWNRYAELDSKFVMGAETYGDTGGTTTHTHDLTVETGAPSTTLSAYGTGTNFADSTHTHSCSTTSSSYSNLPPYSSVIYSQRKTSLSVNLGTEQTENVVPTAPTSLQTEGETTPLRVSDTTPEFSAIFNDPDSGDTAVYYQIEVNTTATFDGTVMWDSTKTAISPVTNGARSSDISYNGTALTLNATTYYWRIKFWDQREGESPWSSVGSFVMSGSPDAPTLLLADGRTNPSSLTTLTPTFSAVHTDPNEDNATHYEIEVNSDTLFTGTVMWNSGQQSMTATAHNSRSPDITYAGTTLSYSDTTYYWRIRFWDTDGNAGEWSSTAQFTASENFFRFEGVGLEGLQIN